MDVKAGDTILFGKYSGQEIKLDGGANAGLEGPPDAHARRRRRDPAHRLLNCSADEVDTELLNAGHEGSIVVQRVKDMKDMKDEEGFNAQTEQYENIVHAGVIDPAKVALGVQNAASMASLLLTTEAVISQIPEEKKHAAVPGGGMGGGMY